jgi:flavin reductase (DIM6/NTAB) family NADH-FMN oxidoreductase RutF
LFSGLEVTQSSYGPVIAQLPNRVFCRFVEKREAGYSGLVVGEIERVEAGDVTDPLVYFRGGYRSLG